jgi:hypothetical protein
MNQPSEPDRSRSLPAPGGAAGREEGTSSLPEPATLTPAAARELIRDIRAHWRPQMLGELGRLYGSQDEDILSRSEILAGEIRLQKLDQYLVSLLPIVRREGGPFGWESFRPPIRAFRRCGSACVEAEVELAFSPENHECVHGPCTLVPVCGLARRLLVAGERLTAVERVTWTIPLRHQIRLRLWDAAQAAEAGRADQEVAVSGRLRTSLGRALEFTGVPLAERPLLVQRDYNGLSLALVAGSRFALGPEPDSVILELTDEALAACRRAIRRRAALCAALLLDLVPVVILNWKRGRPMLDCGFRDVPLPASPAQAFPPGTRIELRYRADHSHLSGRSGLWIGYYEFRYLPWQTGWSTTVMAEADTADMLLRKLHT